MKITAATPQQCVILFYLSHKYTHTQMNYQVKSCSAAIDNALEERILCRNKRL